MLLLNGKPRKEAKMKPLYLFALLLILSTSCGGRHSSGSSDEFISKEEEATIIEEPTIVEDEEPVKFEPLEIKTLLGEDRADFGVSLTEEKFSRTLILTNPNSFEVHSKIFIEVSKFFGIEKSSCREVLKPKESCRLLIAFKAREKGDYKDYLVVHSFSSEGEETKSSALLWGQKVEGDAKTTPRDPRKFITLSTSGVIFKEAKVGQEEIQFIEVINHNFLSYSIKKLEVLHSDVFKLVPVVKGLEEKSCGDIINKGSCLIGVVFAPYKEGRFEAEGRVLFNETEDYVPMKILGFGF